MHRIRQEDVPFRGSSHQFVGADQGGTGVSVEAGPLVRLDIHLGPTFIREDLGA
jgi:hypothetical protein